MWSETAQNNMNENINPPNQKGCSSLTVNGCSGLMAFLVALAGLAILASLAVPTFGRISERGNITKGISNCRQIITAMRIYSSDHDGKYPDAELTDPQNSNEVIRKLFTEGILNNELIIGCPVSPFVPDGNIGHPDDKTFSKAVEAGENHWAMTKGLKDSSPPEIPLVYENPVKPTWPPVWNADAAETNKRGRSWKNGIIIGLNDSSVGIQPLESKKGTAVALKKKDGKDPFEAAIDPTTFPKGEVLNVE
jgi:type II secretory pathway pseudopilin PulG